LDFVDGLRKALSKYFHNFKTKKPE